MAGLFTPKYMQAVMAGQGLGSILVSTLSIITVALDDTIESGGSSSSGGSGSGICSDFRTNFKSVGAIARARARRSYTFIHSHLRLTRSVPAESSLTPFIRSCSQPLLLITALLDTSIARR